MPLYNRAVLALLLGTLIGGGIVLLYFGVYGWTLFVFIPMALGAISCWICKPSSGVQAVKIGALAAGAAALSLLALGLEGAVCILMSMPLVMPLGAFGAMLVFYARSYRHAARGLTMLLLLPPATLTWDMRATPPVYEVRSSIEIAASPETVWKHVVSFSELPPPQEWLFRAGIAYPLRARIEGTGTGAVRYCEFSTGPFVEPIEVWDEPRLLRFRVTENPAPMQEWSPYGSIQPKHLHGYLTSRQGEFRLTKLASGHTLLAGTTRYEHGLWPDTYWRWWSDAIIHRIHMRVLDHIKTLAEVDARAEAGATR